MIGRERGADGPAAGLLGPGRRAAWRRTVVRRGLAFVALSAAVLSTSGLAPALTGSSPSAPATADPGRPAGVRAALDEREVAALVPLLDAASADLLRVGDRVDLYAASADPVATDVEVLAVGGGGSGDGLGAEVGTSPGSAHVVVALPRADAGRVLAGRDPLAGSAGFTVALRATTATAR
ncbi:hypothetical protein [Janibacter sp. G56]|uniref:hypothetical protein n=1 Tax=Janibacter sp. G56 TaxID=3418717 RepID=UPI003D08BE6A